MKKKYPAILVIGIFSLATAVIWISSDVLRSFFFQKPTVTVPSDVLEPLDPNLDTKTLDSVKSAIYFDPQTISVPVIPSESPSASPTPTEAPTAAPSPLVSPTPSPTP